MKKTTKNKARPAGKARKSYTMTAAARRQRANAGKRENAYKGWKTTKVAIELWDNATERFGSVNRALAHLLNK